MALLNILTIPDPRLHLVAKAVKEISKEILTLTDDMLETMYDAPGIGLAATQVNVQLRVVVIDLSEEKNQPLVLINPEITHQDGHIVYEEGCLSVPDLRGLVPGIGGDHEAGQSCGVRRVVQRGLWVARRGCNVVPQDPGTEAQREGRGEETRLREGGRGRGWEGEHGVWASLPGETADGTRGRYLARTW